MYACCTTCAGITAVAAAKVARRAAILQELDLEP
jgi:hypothetical protein